MREILTFLDCQSGDRLFLYGLFTVIVIVVIINGIKSIFDSILKIFINRQKNKIKDSK